MTVENDAEAIMRFADTLLPGDADFLHRRRRPAWRGC